MKATVKIILVDDHEVVRLGLQSLLSLYDHLEIVGECGNAEEALSLVKSKKPDVVLMDIKMPGKNGIEACKEIKEASPSTHIIMLTSFDDDEFIYKSIIAGASGYVLKEIGSIELIHAIDTVAEGKSLLDPTVTARIMQNIRQPAKEDKTEILTSQEKEMLFLISKGLTNRQIANQIMLGEKTVRNYVSVIFSKIEVNNRAEAAAYYVHHQANM